MGTLQKHTSRWELCKNIPQDGNFAKTYLKMGTLQKHTSRWELCKNIPQDGNFAKTYLKMGTLQKHTSRWELCKMLATLFAAWYTIVPTDVCNVFG